MVAMGGPRDRWPLGRGFERFYGFLGGETDQFHPDLVHDNHQIDPPRTPEEGYHLTEDMVDVAIGSTSTTCAPPRRRSRSSSGSHPGPVTRRIRRRRPTSTSYRGAFDQGWDAWRDEVFARQVASGLLPSGTELSERPRWVAAWDSLSGDERRLYARMMEVYAGFLEHTDAQVGRVLDFIDELGELDNTIVVVMSDNGASAEGGPKGSFNEMYFFNGQPESLEENLRRIDELGTPRAHNHYPWGWAWAGNTPLKRWKRETHEGGVADPLIVHWPRGSSRPGETRHQYVHAIDVMPTLLDVIGIEPPELDRRRRPAAVRRGQLRPHLRRRRGRQPPRHAVLRDARLPGDLPRRLEGGHLPPVDAGALRRHPIRGVRSTRTSGSCTTSPRTSRRPPTSRRRSRSGSPSCIELWWEEAERNQVLPLTNQPGRHGDRRYRRDHYEYYAGIGSLPDAVAPNLRNRSWQMTADIDNTTGDAAGVIANHGGASGGYAIYIKDGCLCYVDNFLGTETTIVRADVPLPRARVTVKCTFASTGAFGGGGDVELFHDDAPVGGGKVPRTVPISFGMSGFEVGYQRGPAITSDYDAPFRFTAERLGKVTFDVEGRAKREVGAQERIGMATQ